MMLKLIVKSISSSFSSRLMLPSSQTILNFSTRKGPEFPTFSSKKRPKPLLEDTQKPMFPPSVYDKKVFKIDQYGLPLLTPKDYTRRLEFSTRVLDRMNNDKSFLPSIVFSDEGNFRLFKLPGAPKQDKNNRRFHESPKVPVIVWCGMTSRHIIGPFFFNSYVTENTYLHMVKTFVIPKLKELGYSLDKTWFQQDGAPPHRSEKVLKFLHKKFGSRLISHGCKSFFWPSRSQDLTPLDYFLWDYLKRKLETNYRPTNTLDMKECISLELENIDQDVLEKVVFNLRDRLQACIQADGNRFDTPKLLIH